MASSCDERTQLLAVEGGKVAETRRRVAVAAGVLAATGLGLLGVSRATPVIIRNKSSLAAEEEDVFPPREPFGGGVVRRACVNNDDDLRFRLKDPPDSTDSCPYFDVASWCSKPQHTGPGTKFDEVCHDACVDPDFAYAMVCAWEAVANMRAVCDGRFVPTRPAHSRNAPNDASGPLVGDMVEGGRLYDCDEHAVCHACFSGSAADADGEMCERVAAHYGGFGAVEGAEMNSGYTGAESAFKALNDMDRWCESLDNQEKEREYYGFAPAWRRGFGGSSHGYGEYVQRWGTPGAIPLQEHIVRDSRQYKARFSKDAYAYWRFGLLGKEGEKKFDAELHVYTTEDVLARALDERRLLGGSVVFVDVLYSLIEAYHVPSGGGGKRNDQSLEALQDPQAIDAAMDACYAGSNAKKEFCEDRVNRECVYQFADNLVLRSKTLRKLLAYEQPLTIVLAGDLSCRLDHELPPTHHKLLVANDGALDMVESYNRDLEKTSSFELPRASWFPFGLEGVEVELDDHASALDAASSGEKIRDDVELEPPLPASERKFFIGLSASLNRRKPSRTYLFEWLVDGGYDALENLRLAKAPGLESVFDFTDERPGANDERIHLGANGRKDVAEMTRLSLFSIAPAGDFWTSGRVIESLMLGSVPIVDATYATDGGLSAKNCGDPAKFWRDGSDDFPVKAPFVFVENWRDLPDAIDRFMRNKTLDSIIADAETYRKALEDHLRALPTELMGRLNSKAPAVASTCETTHFTPDERDAIVSGVRDYWLSGENDAYVDSPGRPGIGCTKFQEIFEKWPEPGVKCFSDKCSPPLVADFSCTLHEISSSSSSR